MTRRRYGTSSAVFSHNTAISHSRVRLSGHATGLDLLTQLRGQPALASTPAIVMTGGVLSDAEKGVVEKNGGVLFYKPDGLSALIGFLQQITSQRPAH